MQIYHEEFLLDSLTPITLYSLLKEQIPDKQIHMLESIVGDKSSASMFTIGARESIISKNGKSIHIDESHKENKIQKNPLLFLREYYKNFDKQEYAKETKRLNVKFLDGFIGYIGYDMIKYFEPRLQEPMDLLEDTIGIDDFSYIRPEIIITFIHISSKVIITTTSDKYKELLSFIKDILSNPTIKNLSIKKISPIKEIKYHHSKEEFVNIIRKCKKMIRSGDVFQILPSNRAIIKANIDKTSFYRALRYVNPSPYMFFLNYDDFSIIGSSPEQLVSLNENITSLKPIAGTRKRGIDNKRDKELEEELIKDEKERAEHIMLVDLGRNDLGKVSVAGSVKAKELMKVEKYSHVMHLVSSLNSILDSKYDMFDLVMATFTAGTMTGTPKIRAMELIAEYEGLKRGFYSGSVGYFGFDGNMDSAIMIRTALLKKNEIILQAGAGIVADSQEELECLEVENKLKALIKALELLSQDSF